MALQWICSLNVWNWNPHMNFWCRRRIIKQQRSSTFHVYIKRIRKKISLDEWSLLRLNLYRFSMKSFHTPLQKTVHQIKIQQLCTKSFTCFVYNVTCTVEHLKSSLALTSWLSKKNFAVSFRVSLLCQTASAFLPFVVSSPLPASCHTCMFAQMCFFF